MKETETTLFVEVRQCVECKALYEDNKLSETTALREKIERQKSALALSVKQYNEGVDAAKAGFAAGPRPEFDTSTWYDGYAATMLPILRERIAELEAEKERTCAWKIDEDGVYWTLCDNAHEFIIGGPNENYFEFCPYCGKRLIVVEVNDCEYLKGGE